MSGVLLEVVAEVDQSSLAMHLCELGLGLHPLMLQTHHLVTLEPTPLLLFPYRAALGRVYDRG